MSPLKKQFVIVHVIEYNDVSVKIPFDAYIV